MLVGSAQCCRIPLGSLRIDTSSLQAIRRREEEELHLDLTVSCFVSCCAVFFLTWTICELIRVVGCWRPAGGSILSPTGEVGLRRRIAAGEVESDSGLTDSEDEDEDGVECKIWPRYGGKGFKALIGYRWTMFGCVLGWIAVLLELILPGVGRCPRPKWDHLCITSRQEEREESKCGSDR